MKDLLQAEEPDDSGSVSCGHAFQPRVLVLGALPCVPGGPGPLESQPVKAVAFKGAEGDDIGRPLSGGK
jgi:hypothetical protein